MVRKVEFKTKSSLKLSCLTGLIKGIFCFRPVLLIAIAIDYSRMTLSLSQFEFLK